MWPRCGVWLVLACALTMAPQVQHWKTRAETTEQRIAQLQAQVTGTIDVTASATDRRDDGIAQVDVVQSMHGDGDSSVRTRETGASGGYTASDIDGSEGGMRFAADTTDDLFVAPSSAEAQLDALLAQVRTDLAVSLRNQHRVVVADAVAGAVEATALERDEEWQRLVHEWRHRKLATLHRLRREEGVGMLAELEASHGVEAVMAYICGPAWDGKPMWPACDATTEESTSIAMTPARQGQGPHGGSPGDAAGTPGASSSGGADADAAAAAERAQARGVGHDARDASLADGQDQEDQADQADQDERRHQAGQRARARARPRRRGKVAPRVRRTRRHPWRAARALPRQWQHHRGRGDCGGLSAP